MNPVPGVSLSVFFSLFFTSYFDGPDPPSKLT